MNNIHIHQFAEELRLRNYAERTIHDYTLNVKEFFSYLADEESVNSINEIRPDHIRSYQLHNQNKVCRYNKPMTTKSICTKMNSTKAFFRLMFESGLIRNDLEGCIKLPRIKNRAPQNIPDEKEIAEFLDSVVPSSIITLRDRTILEILYSTGLRNSELRNLAIDNLDIQAQKFYIKAGKGGESRTVSIGEWLVPLIQKYLELSRPHFINNETNILFPSKNGLVLTKGNLRDMVRKYALKFGISKRITPHTFRHCCTTHLLKAGCDLRYVQLHLGHRDIKSTIIYTDLITEDIKEAHAKYHPRQKEL
jgi:integrase/recombinase XerD